MENNEIIKKYASSELDVVWKPNKCTHAGECVKSLPQVYSPKEKPWIKPENASTDELIAQISKCPSGALGYELHETNNKEIK